LSSNRPMAGWNWMQARRRSADACSDIAKTSLQTQKTPGADIIREPRAT
jgi:hypothetical protein